LQTVTRLDSVQATHSEDASRHRVGVFGGTFDPIHVGHLIVAEIMCHALDLAHVIFLPAGHPPHKPNQVLSSDAHRLAMLDIALRGDDCFSISRIDIERTGWSYTSESLCIIQNELGPDSEIYFVMGQDSLRDFPTWHQPAEIARQARLAVAMRPGVVVKLEDVYSAVPETVDRIDIVPIPLIGISSREIRANVRSGGPYRYQVVPGVADYIKRQRLYLDSDTTSSDDSDAMQSG
jgi:nicotinate-nucleotide adenylyltransferase